MTASTFAAQRQQLVAEALSWHGTRYHHHGRIKGVGVDCAMLLAEVFHTCGLVPRVEPGHYPREWHLHHGDELFLGWLQRLGARPVAVGQPGDVAVYRFGHCYSHGGIVVDTAGTVIHAHIASRRVITTRADESPLAGVPCLFYTLIEG